VTDLDPELAKVTTMVAGVGAGGPREADEGHGHVAVASWVRVEQPAAVEAGEAGEEAVRATGAYGHGHDPVRVRRP
jgi:hypothetical protein